MKKKEYMAHLHVALVKAGLRGALVPGDKMSSVAMHLPSPVLRAVIGKQVQYDEGNKIQGAIPFHMGWIQACDDELSDRILTETLDEGKELQEEASTDQSEADALLSRLVELSFDLDFED